MFKSLRTHGKDYQKITGNLEGRSPDSIRHKLFALAGQPGKLAEEDLDIVRLIGLTKEPEKRSKKSSFSKEKQEQESNL